MDKIRINKYISDTGLCSRREADQLVAKGLVTVNGKKAEMGTKVGSDDFVKVKNKPLKGKRPNIYIALNKPAGITCTTDLRDKDNIIDFIKFSERIFPIGRLDRASEGLLFLTNDGDIVNKILRAGNNHEKEYLVTVNKEITDDFIKKMGNGIFILNTKTNPCKVIRINKKTFKIILTQGLNRQIRRMCEALHYEVVKLVRVRIMNVDLKGINLGKWRYLTKSEMSQINKLVASSSKTEEASKNSTSKKQHKTKKWKVWYLIELWYTHTNI